MVLVAIGVTGDPAEGATTVVLATEVGVCVLPGSVLTDCAVGETVGRVQARVADAPETTTDEALGIPVNGILKAIYLLSEIETNEINTPLAVADSLSVSKLLPLKVKTFVNTVDKSLAKRHVKRASVKLPTIT